MQPLTVFVNTQRIPVLTSAANWKNNNIHKIPTFKYMQYIHQLRVGDMQTALHH
jgi:hypothetical protein